MTVVGIIINVPILQILKILRNDAGHFKPTGIIAIVITLHFINMSQLLHLFSCILNLSLHNCKH